jgi:hypothetical protein
MPVFYLTQALSMCVLLSLWMWTMFDRNEWHPTPLNNNENTFVQYGSFLTFSISISFILVLVRILFLNFTNERNWKKLERNCQTIMNTYHLFIDLQHHLFVKFFISILCVFCPISFVRKIQKQNSDQNQNIKISVSQLPLSCHFNSHLTSSRIWTLEFKILSRVSYY